MLKRDANENEIWPVRTSRRPGGRSSRAARRARGWLAFAYAFAFALACSAPRTAWSATPGRAPAAHGEPERSDAHPQEEDAEPPFAAGADIVSGVRGVRPEMRALQAEQEPELEESSPRETHCTSIILELEYRFSEKVSLGARAAASTAGFLFTAHGEDRATSIGNIEIAPRYSSTIGRGVHLAYELGLALPTATGDEFSSSLAARRLAHTNLAAARFRGFSDNALFATHRVGVVPKVLFASRREWLDIDAFAKVEVLARAGGSAPPREWEIQNGAVEAVVGAHVEKTFGVVGMASQAWAAYTMVGEVKALERPDGEHASPLQVMLEPQAFLDTTRVRAAFGVLFPMGGRLGEWGYIAGRFALTVHI